MKNTMLIISLIFLVAVPNGHLMSQRAVDLGLPSGTKWMQFGEKGYYTESEAIEKYGDNLPTEEQLKELIDKCEWTWDGNRFKVSGPNGKYIYLEAYGFRDEDGRLKQKNILGIYWYIAYGSNGRLGLDFFQLDKTSPTLLKGFMEKYLYPWLRYSVHLVQKGTPKTSKNNPDPPEAAAVAEDDVDTEAVARVAEMVACGSSPELLGKNFANKMCDCLKSENTEKCYKELEQEYKAISRALKGKDNNKFDYAYQKNAEPCWIEHIRKYRELADDERVADDQVKIDERVADDQVKTDERVADDQVYIEEDEKIYTVVENDPDFPGGTDALYKYLSENIKYPQLARDNNITGKVYITFIVEKDGRLSNPKILRDIGGGCGAEAIRVLKSMPKWIPGKQRGKPVRVQFNLPVNFKP